MKDGKLFLFGLIWTGFTIFMIYLTMTRVMGELSAVDDSIPVADLDALKQQGEGKLVSFEATIAADNALIIKQFVLGCEEYYDDSGETSTWRTEAVYVQPLTMTFNDGAVVADFSDDCPRGATQRVSGRSDQRWIGVQPGDRLHIVGGVLSVSPARVDVVHYYSGSAQAHRDELTSSRNLAGGFLGVFMLIGVGMMIAGGRPG